ncbi:hypothetical protein ColTof4_14042 [Colletotrichum tofieldiae]|nr:hypothetical protein ColTof3_14677 [Colletotrichum tofieldiae]GKT81619.1 hypothetical protein ColTof4_14042 [Colletotrichum tofieldiae]GKT97593.1 hypothetical protein Ct61P_15443 [Colletotrichum tofieldiae]
MNPRIIAEITYSSPSTLEALEERCTNFLRDSNGHIQAAVAIKIVYDSSNSKPATHVLQQLHQCFAAVWELRNGKVKRVMPWTSLDTPDANPVLCTSYVTTASVNNKPTEQRGRQTAICVLFATLREKLRRAVAFANPCSPADM